MTYQYSYYNDRGVIYEGNFREQPSRMFKVGDWFLTHHICSICNVRIMEKVQEMRKCMTFNDEPIYDLITTHGSSYKSNLLHTSLYDLIINKEDLEITMKHFEKYNKNVDKKSDYNPWPARYKRLAFEYFQSTDINLVK